MGEEIQARCLPDKVFNRGARERARVNRADIVVLGQCPSRTLGALKGIQ